MKQFCWAVLLGVATTVHEQAEVRVGGSFQLPLARRVAPTQEAGQPQPLGALPADARVHRASADGETEFDFLIGEWRVHHRRLKEILNGSTEWYEFDGSLAARKLWQGRGHIDEFRADSPRGPVDGISIRIYDPSSRQWRDYYTSASARVFDQPLVGRFDGSRAEFYGHQLDDGRSIFVRQVWTRQAASSSRWEQAFSVDGGRTWETNWIMDLTR